MYRFKNCLTGKKKGGSLHLFLHHFPSVSLDQALNALQKHVHQKTSGVIHFDAEIASDTAVFVGTRVPVKNLFIYLIEGYNLKDFHYDFPTVLREQTGAVLEMARDVLEQNAYKAPNSVFHSDHNIMGGTPVFMGTRLPVKNLFDCLTAAYSLKDFYYEFPSAESGTVGGNPQNGSESLGERGPCGYCLTNQLLGTCAIF